MPSNQTWRVPVYVPLIVMVVAGIALLWCAGHLVKRSKAKWPWLWRCLSSGMRTVIRSAMLTTVRRVLIWALILLAVVLSWRSDLARLWSLITLGRALLALPCLAPGLRRN